MPCLYFYKHGYFYEKDGEQMRLECDFIFDGIPSTEYELQILSLGEAPDSEVLVADKEYTKIIAPNDTRYRILNVSEKNPLTFNLQIFPTNEHFLSSDRIQVITNWMFNQIDYKKLQILDSKISHLYFNCIFTNITKLMMAQNVIGIECTVECDSNGAWEFEKTNKYDFTLNGVGTIFFNNISSDIKGLRPILTIEMFEDANFNMTSLTTGQQIVINNLNMTEKITMDCDNQIISSNLDKYLFDDFNGEFLCMKKGLNSISVSGKCKITMIYQNQAKVGG